jgi:RNA exonuclease 4
LYSVNIGRYVALDCEMVGVGPDPDHTSALARVSIVNYHGVQIYDSFVLPIEPVTDWRTPVSGIVPANMRTARSLDRVQRDVFAILNGRVLVGHAIRNDLRALLLSHPRPDIRDTSRHLPFRQLVAGGGSPALKALASTILGVEIQAGAHSSVEDARVTMLLFQREKEAFEREHARKYTGGRRLVTTVASGGTAATAAVGRPAKKGKKKKTKKKKHKRANEVAG